MTDLRYQNDGGTSHYNAVSKLLHWSIATLILIQIGIGWYMNDWLPDHSPAQGQVVAIHVSIGLTILLLVLARVIWRLSHRMPPLPSALRPWERILARSTHALFYVLMLGLPLTGWALVSAGKSPVAFWGLAWPKLPGVAAAAAQGGRAFRHTLQETHTSYLVWLILATLALHVAGALKHQFDGHPVLWRMLPGGRAPKEGRAA